MLSFVNDTEKENIIEILAGIMNDRLCNITGVHSDRKHAQLKTK